MKLCCKLSRSESAWGVLKGLSAGRRVAVVAEEREVEVAVSLWEVRDATAARCAWLQ